MTKGTSSLFHAPTVHQQTAFLITLLIKGKQHATQSPDSTVLHTRTHKTESVQESLTAGWVRFGGGRGKWMCRDARTRASKHTGPCGRNPFTFPSRRRSAWRTRSLWNTKTSYTADTASTVTPCSFHSMLAAAHHRLASIQPQHRATALLWSVPRGSSRSSQCLM